MRDQSSVRLVFSHSWWWCCPRNTSEYQKEEDEKWNEESHLSITEWWWASSWSSSWKIVIETRVEGRHRRFLSRDCCCSLTTHLPLLSGFLTPNTTCITLAFFLRESLCLWKQTVAHLSYLWENIVKFDHHHYQQRIMQNNGHETWNFSTEFLLKVHS